LEPYQLAGKKRRGPIVIAKCVWGDAYIKTMLSLNIPSLLSKNNIGALLERNLEHHIYTTADDREKIESHSTYKNLAALIKCRILVPDIDCALNAETPYDTNIARMNAYHQRIIDDCEEIGAVWLFDQPDHIWGDGSLRHLVELAEDEWDVALFPGVRANLDETASAIENWRDKETGALNIPRRSLVDLALKNMHFHDLTRFWGPVASTDWPHHMAWRVAPGCFMRRSFYPQPFLINTANRPRLVRSIDFSYIETAMKRGDRVHFITNTDDFFILEVSRKYQLPSYSVGRMSAPLIGNWAIRYAGASHIEAFSKSVVFHTDNVIPRRLSRINRFADTLSITIKTMVELDRIAVSIATERPRAAAFIRLCLNQKELVRRIELPNPFTLSFPSETEIPDLTDFRSPLSPSAVEHIVEWVGRHVVPSASGKALVGPSETAEVISQ
jgi:hypothetical protein